MTGTFRRSPHSLSCSTAAARKVSHAARRAVWPRAWTRCASLAAVVVLPVPLTPTMETTVNPSRGCLRNRPVGRRPGSARPRRGRWQRHPGRRGPGFRKPFDGGDDLGGHGRAQVGGDQGGFQFLQAAGGQFGRGGEDAFDFVGQLVVRFEQALFELLKQTHDVGLVE
jgi:hypothetical protein